MRTWHRWLWTLVVAGAGGCAATVRTPPATRRSGGLDAQSMLSLDQIQPAPRFAHPTTRPHGRPPVEALVLYARARDEMQQGQPLQAAVDLDRAATLDPARFDVLFALGRANVSANSPEAQSIAAFKRAEAVEPAHLALQTELGRLYLSKGDVPSALAHLRLATQAGDYQTDASQAAVADLFLAKALKAGGYDRAALDQYGKLLDRFHDPEFSVRDNPDLAYIAQRPDLLFVQIGEVYERHGLYDEALRAFHPALERDPGNFDLRARVARDLARANRRDAALQQAADLVARDGASPPTLDVLRDVCRILRLPGGEVDALRRLSESRPNDQPVRFALAEALVAQGSATEARHLLETAWHRAPGDVPLTRRLFAADVASEPPDIDAAARLLITALARDPEAVHNLGPLWNDLTRSGRPSRLTLARLTAMTVEPRDEPARQFWLAQTAERLHRPATAAAALDRATQLRPAFAPAFRAKLALGQDQHDRSDGQKVEAADALAKRAESAGAAALAAEVRGRAALAAKDVDRAQQCFAAAAAAGGRSADLRLVAAQARKGVGADAAFERSLWQIIGDHPCYEDAYVALFSYYADPSVGSVEQAMKVLATWNVSDPASVSARVALARSDLQLNQTAEAGQLVARLLADAPDDPEVFNVGLRWAAATNGSQALIDQLSRHRNPRDVDRVAELVAVYVDQHRNPEAVRLLDDTRAAVAGDADLLYALAGLYTVAGQAAETLDVLEQVVQLDPQHPGACNDLGFAWADQGRNLDRAERLIRRAVAAEPDDPAFLDSLGWVLYKRAEFAESRKCLEQAVAAAPDADPAVLDHLGDAIYRLQQPADAVQVWQRAVAAMVESGGEQATLRLQLQEKIKAADLSRPVTVAPVP